MNARVINMTGKQFGSITAIRQAGKSASGDLTWVFACNCGNEFVANGYYARCGKITTCPVCSRERVRLASVLHGLSETVEFSTWTDIQTRCHNQNSIAYENYGGRGIVVCQRWRDSFADFLADMGRRPSKAHSIDRWPDNNGDYAPGNCRWATRQEQANNKRNSHRITIDGVTKSMAQWASESGVNYNAMWFRAKAGKRGSQLLAKTKGTI